MDLLAKLSHRLASQYEPLQEFFLWPVLKLCERANRILADRAKAVLLLLVQQPWPLKIVMTRLLECKASQNKSLRLCIVEATNVIMAHVSPEALVEYEGQLVRLIADSLQDAAESVRASSRPLYSRFVALFPTSAPEITSRLPASILKAISGTLGAAANNAAPGTASVRSLLASKRTVTVGDVPPSSAKSGPQRIVSRPQPPATTVPSVAGTPHSLRPEKGIINAKLPLRLGKPSMSSSLATVDTDMGPKPLPASSSSGTLPSVGLKPRTLPASSSLGKLPSLAASSLSSSSSASSVVASQPKYRRLLSDFKEKLRQAPAWDARCRTLDEFSTTTLLQDEFRSEIVNAKASKLELFDIFLAGLLDVHHKVVHSVLAYGRAILAVVPSDKHPGATSFATFAIIRLFKIIFDIQFRTRQALLDEARQLVAALGTWLGSPVLYFDCLVNSVTRQDRALGFKMRKEAYDTLTLFVMEGGLPFATAEESFTKLVTNAVRKLALILTEPEEATKEAVASCIEELVKRASLSGWNSLIPFESRQYLEAYMSRDLLMPASPTMTNIEVSEGFPKGDMDTEREPVSCRPSPSRKMAIDEIILDAELGISMKIRPRSPFPVALPSTSPSEMTPTADKVKVDFDTPRHTHAVEEESANEEEGEIAQGSLLPSDREEGELVETNESAMDAVITMELLGLQ